MKTLKRMLSLLIAIALIMPAAGLAATDPRYVTTEEPDPIPVLSEDEILPTPEGIEHYMLICNDLFNYTDGLILVTVDRLAHRVMLTSFIRDMLIQRPDGKFGRINNVARFFGGINAEGIGALIDTINSHFGLRIKKYIVVNFQQVEKIVDAVGGVDIEITNHEATYLYNYRLSSTSTTPSLSPARGGVYHFTGHAAVIYMRIRKVRTISGATQDVGRTERARTVLTTIADSLKDISFEDAMKLLQVVMENTVLTNMSSADLTHALSVAWELRGTPVEGIRMPIDGTYELMPVSGMATQQIDYIKNREALEDFLYGAFVVAE